MIFARAVIGFNSSLCFWGSGPGSGVQGSGLEKQDAERKRKSKADLPQRGRLEAAPQGNTEEQTKILSKSKLKLFSTL